MQALSAATRFPPVTCPGGGHAYASKIHSCLPPRFIRISRIHPRSFLLCQIVHVGTSTHAPALHKHQLGYLPSRSSSCLLPAAVSLFPPSRSRPDFPNPDDKACTLTHSAVLFFFFLGGGVLTPSPSTFSCLPLLLVSIPSFSLVPSLSLLLPYLCGGSNRTRSCPRMSNPHPQLVLPRNSYFLLPSSPAPAATHRSHRLPCQSAFVRAIHRHSCRKQPLHRNSVAEPAPPPS